MGTWIVGGIVLAILGAAGYTVVRDRKRGKGCSGCPDRDSCAKRPRG